ncbi:uncharacterized [Tachysurus ichikawai]
MTEAVSDKAPVPDQSSAKLLPALSLFSDERKRMREGVKKKSLNEGGMLGVPFLLFDIVCVCRFPLSHSAFSSPLRSCSGPRDGGVMTSITA